VEPEQPAPRRKLPRSIGRYRIIDRLGKGAMGVVYSAHDSLMERSVAIKIMMTDIEDDPEISTRFYREARAAGQLVHPNIITIFDMGEDDGRPFIVMELLEGQTLNKHIETPDGADLERRIELMIQICSGLNAAHSRGIFHRDIKPGNLLVRANGELKIVDFGIARLASSSMTASGLIVGTPDYMSPEQARGQEVDQRSDIFSAGAVFYLMLTGRKPFAAPDLTAVLAKVQGEAPLPIRDTEAPAPLARLVMKALAKQPADRYQSCAEMMAELEHLQRDLETETQQWVEECGQRLQALESLGGQRRTLIASLDIDPPPADVDAARADLLGRRALLTEPYRRRAVADLLAEIRAAQQSQAAEVDTWQRALKSVDEGSRLAAAGTPREAIPHFEEALRIEPVSRRAATEVDRCRAAVEAQRAIDERAAALLEQARKAAAARQWQSAIVLCDDALLLDGRAAEAKTLKLTAVAAIEAEARDKRRQVEKALERAEAYRRKGRFQDATVEIARARTLDSNAEVDAAEERLRNAIADAEREAIREKEAAEALAAARNTFAAGRHDEALANLRAFHERVPHSMVGAEITRLDAEAKRIAAAEKRAAEAAEHAKSAEAALTGGDPDQALALASRALAIDPGHLLARKVSGLASAEMKQRAEAKTRAEKAARLIADAEEQLSHGRFQKARQLVSSAAELDPANGDHKLLLARINQEEADAEAEVERQRLARQRAKAVAPILERARAAEAKLDYERAAWTAENALAVDLECVEAKEILERARVQLAANPRTPDDTVDLTDGSGRAADSEDTVSLTRQPTLWERMTDVLKKWMPGERPEISKTRPADDPYMKT
jgi:eukaryotic-like serine/threonine-protein kinase